MLPDGEFPINVWSRDEISQLLNKDVQADEISFGRLPVTYFIFSVVFRALLATAFVFYLYSHFILVFIQIDQLKPQFGVDHSLFGGLQGLGKFVRVHVPQNCSEQVCNLFCDV